MNINALFPNHQTVGGRETHEDAPSGLDAARLVVGLDRLVTAVLAAPLIANGMAPADAITVALAARLRADRQGDPLDRPEKQGTCLEQARAYLEAIPRMHAEELARREKAKAEREQKREARLARKGKGKPRGDLHVVPSTAPAGQDGPAS